MVGQVRPVISIIGLVKGHYRSEVRSEHTISTIFCDGTCHIKSISTRLLCGLYPMSQKTNIVGNYAPSQRSGHNKIRDVMWMREV